ncbi:MAG TPA: NUDIX domain-containing protein [Dermatophilaceae bacterium]|nr:NUDIX domain-containing protein [Dermatophilaceae bacterium]
MPVPEFVLELRRHVGHAPLWLIGSTAVVLREIDGAPHVLLVRRADTGGWSPVTGIVDPGEGPYETAVRECREEAGVEVVAERLVWVRPTGMVSYPNGDRSHYLDHTLRCRWVSGEPHVADDENLDARWWPVTGLPELRGEFAERVAVALADQPETRLG